MASMHGLSKSQCSVQEPGMAYMINKIGSKRAKWFAVLDLTSGYHQAPIDEKSKHLTAFRTANGLWEWNRLPMGLQGAGSYFQHNVQHVVLKDMIGKIVEIYSLAGGTHKLAISGYEPNILILTVIGEDSLFSERILKR